MRHDRYTAIKKAAPVRFSADSGLLFFISYSLVIYAVYALYCLR